MFAVPLALVFTIPADPPKELPPAAKDELKTLEGKWKVVKVLHPDLATTPAADGYEAIVAFKGSAIDFNGAGAGEVIELDPATDPKCLDFKVGKESGVLKEGATCESVYKLDGDTLTWAMYVGRGKNRPATFDKPAVKGGIVFVLERVKE